MFVPKSVVTILTRENARLRREVERKDRVILELIDKYSFNKQPQRLVSDTPNIFNSPSTTTTFPSDAYSQAIEDAERRAQADLPTFEVEDIDEDA